METNRTEYRAPARTTEMTGPRLRAASVRNIEGKALALADGATVGMTRWYDCGDGGDISGWFTGTIVRMARGTEGGMHGSDTLLVTVRWDRAEAGAESTFAARHLARC